MGDSGVKHVILIHNLRIDSFASISRLSPRQRSLQEDGTSSDTYSTPASLE